MELKNTHWDKANKNNIEEKPRTCCGVFCVLSYKHLDRFITFIQRLYMEQQLAGKRWKEYALEFIMLFLAVTLGFLAENYREDYGEREREVELARSLYNEMKADSVDLSKAIGARAKKEYYLDYLYTNYTGDSDIDSIQKKHQVALMIGLASTSPTIFEPRNAIINQLESSGMLRYFKNEKIQADLHNIINSAEKIKSRLEGENQIYQKFVLPITLKYRNYEMVRKITKDDDPNKTMLQVIDEYEKSNEFYKFPKQVISPDDFKELHRTFEYYRFLVSSTRKGIYMIYQRDNAALLNDLRVYYKL